MKRLIMTVVTFVVLFGGATPLTAQEETYPRMAEGEVAKELPDTWGHCVAIGPLITWADTSVQFPPGRALLTPELREQTNEHVIPKLREHAKRPDAGLRIVAGEDPMLWDSIARAEKYRHDMNDVVTKILRAEDWGQDVARKLGLDPSKIRIDILAGEYLRMAAAAPCVFREGEDDGLTLAELTATIEEMGGDMSKVIRRLGLLEQRVDKVEDDVGDLKVRMTAVEQEVEQVKKGGTFLSNVGIELGVGYGFANEGYNMPRGEIGLFVGDDEKINFALTGWYAHSFSTTEKSFSAGNDTTTFVSEIQPWGYGGQGTLYLTDLPLSLGIVGGYANYENLMIEMGEFTERVRGKWVGLEGRVKLFNHLHLVGNAGWKWYELKPAAGVSDDGGRATHHNGPRFAMSVRVPVIISDIF